MPTSDAFLLYSKSIAKRFVQTVVLVDDEAFDFFLPGEKGLRVPSSAPGDKQTASDSAQASLVTAAAPTAAVAVEPKPSSVDGPAATQSRPATEDEIDEALDGRRLIQLFAKEGLICAVLRPDEKDPDIKDATLAAASRADVVILDWIFHGDGGEKAKELVAAIVSADGGTRLRLIIIYTGDPKAPEIAKEINEAVGGGLQEDGDYSLRGNSLRIVVLAKEGTATKGLGNVVALKSLPDRVLTEFAAILCGLVSNVALQSIAVVRENTHELLARLHPRLDAPFLAHRLLLINPEEATDFAADIVGQELAALLHGFDVGGVSGEEAIKAWLGRDGLQLAPKAAAHGVKSVEDAIALLTKGLKDCGLTTLSPGPGRFYRVATSLFDHDANSSNRLDHELAYRASMVERYGRNQPPPMLTLGAVVLERMSKMHLVCIQPVCDSVRLKNTTPFMFLRATPVADEDEGANLVIKDSGAGSKLLKLRVSSATVDLKQHVFEPGQSGVISASSSDGLFRFEDIDGVKLDWISQLKFAYAQRFAQRFSTTLSRVGLDEPEWLRLTSRAKGD